MALTWKEAELAVAKAVNGTVVKDKKLQIEEDIDVVDEKGLTYSVKNQQKALETGNISLELGLIDSDGKAIPGNWARCSADFMVIVIGRQAYYFSTTVLNHYARAYKDFRPISPASQATNAGRKYSRALNLIIPLSELAPFATIEELQ